MKIIVLSQKGEMAKSTTAVNVTAAFMQSGQFSHGTIVDLDVQQCDASKFAQALKPLQVECSVKIPDTEQDNSLMVIDTSPQITPETGRALQVSDIVVIPCTPYALSLEALARTFQTVAQAVEVNPKLEARVLFTRVDNTQYTQGMIAAARALSEWPVLQTTIPNRKSEFERSVAARRPVVLQSPKGAGAQAYKALYEEICHVTK